MEKSIKILVAHHKEGLIINNNDVYLPIHVGKILHPDVKLGIQGDDEGENISCKNPIYCEMTAWYWAWKNLKADYIGLCHYRRYFTFDKPSFFRNIRQHIRYWYFRICGNIIQPGKTCELSSMIQLNSKNLFKDKALIFSKGISKILNSDEYDLVIPTPYKWSGLTNAQYFVGLGREHFQLLSEIISNDTPEYFEVYNETMQSNVLYAANMAIFSTDLFEEYCDFVFPVLKRHEELTVKRGWCKDLINEKAYSRRSGYFAELLTSAFISKQLKSSKKALFVNTMFLNL